MNHTLVPPTPAVQATSAEVDAVIEHMRTYTSPKKDYRQEIRAMEEEIFAEHAAFLIGNQAVDFKKQDGVTEVEESVQANLVERRLQDMLLEDEEAGKVVINRAPAYVGCVSNFTNFLDLSRKGLRNMELGVPIVVLSRSNTAQHMYRWVQLLHQLMPKYGIDAGMVTFLCANIEEQRRVISTAAPT